MRAILLSLEERIGAEIDAYLFNRLHKDDDGKVSYDRVKGKKPTVVGIEFGEKVVYMRANGRKYFI
eukprot:10182747-Karenia_brevis.AAC.1